MSVATNIAGREVHTPKRPPPGAGYPCARPALLVLEDEDDDEYDYE
jgi:hypothetical protein